MYTIEAILAYEGWHCDMLRISRGLTDVVGEKKMKFFSIFLFMDIFLSCSPFDRSGLPCKKVQKAAT